MTAPMIRITRDLHGAHPMTAPMSPEQKQCPCCRGYNGEPVFDPPAMWHTCPDCNCVWDPRLVRASLAPAEAERRDADYDAEWAEVREHTEQLKKDAERLEWVRQKYGDNITTVETCAMSDIPDMERFRSIIDAAMKKPGRG